MLRRISTSRGQQDNHHVVLAARPHGSSAVLRMRGSNNNPPSAGGRRRYVGITTIGFVLASLACVIVTDFVVYGIGSDRSPIYTLLLVVLGPHSSSGSLSREMQVKKSPWPRAERGRQLYRRVVALSDAGDGNQRSSQVGADIYFLRDRSRGPARRYPKMVMALAHFEDREGFRRSLFWTIEHDKLKLMKKRQLSLPFYDGLNLFSSGQDGKQSPFGRVLLDLAEDEAKLAQQKTHIRNETEEHENDQSQGKGNLSPECMRRAHVLLQFSTCNAFHERRVGADVDDWLSGDYLDLLLARCECAVSHTN